MKLIGRGDIHAVLIILVLILGLCPWGHDPWILPKMFLTCLILLDWAINQRVAVKTLVDRPALIVLGVMAVLVVMSKDPINSLIGLEDFRALGLLQLVIYALLFNLAVMSDPVLIRQTVVLAAIPMVIYAISQRLGHEIPWITWHTIPHRGISTQGSPLFVGSIITMAFPIALTCARRPGKRLWWAAAAAIIFAGAWGADCRSAVVGMLVGSLVYFHLRATKPGNEEVGTDSVIMLVIFMGCVLAAAAGVVWFLRVGIRPTDQQRLELWKTCFLAWGKNTRLWLFGWGPENCLIPFREYRSQKLVDMMGQAHVQFQAHNLILQLLLTTGTLGWITAWYFNFKLARAVDMLGVAVLAGLLAQSMFEPIPFQAWALLALILGSRAHKTLEGSKSKPIWMRYAAGASFLLVGLIYISDVTWGLAMAAAHQKDYGPSIRWVHISAALNPTSINAMQGEVQIGEDPQWRLRTFHPYDARGNQVAGLESIMRNEWGTASVYLSRAHEQDPLHSGIAGMLEQANYFKKNPRRKKTNGRK